MSKPPPLAAIQRNAQAMHDAGNRAGARQLLAQAVEAGRPAYGEDHPDVLATAHLLARLHTEDDDPTAARRVLEEALAAGQRRFGDADPLILAISFDLGRVAEELGNRHEARRNFTRVSTAGPAVLGADHPAVRAARAYLDGQQQNLPPAFDAEPPTRPLSAPPAEPPTRPLSAPPAEPPTRPVSALTAPEPPTRPIGALSHAEPPTRPISAPTAPEPPTQPLSASPVGPPARTGHAGGGVPAHAAPPHPEEATRTSSPGPGYHPEEPTRPLSAMPPEYHAPAARQPAAVPWSPPGGYMATPGPSVPAVPPGPAGPHRPVTPPGVPHATALSGVPATAAPPGPAMPPGGPPSGMPPPGVTDTAGPHRPGQAGPIYPGQAVSDLALYPVIMPSAPAPAPVAPVAPPRGRTATVAAIVAAVAAVVAAAVGVVAVFTDGDPDPPVSPGASPTTVVGAGAPPTDLRLRDDQAAITITWTDPSAGTVPFVVAGGRAGQQLGAMATVDPGRTSHTINGLNPRVDYCFTVLAVYATDNYAASGQVCTTRGGSPTPTG